MKKKFLAAMIALLAALLVAPAVASAQSDAVSVEFNGLEPLGSELVYEGWLIIDGAPVTSGTFNIAPDGSVVPIKQVQIANSAEATDYVLTLEPAVDPDPAPAPTHILGGPFVDGVAQLTFDHFQAFGLNFDDASGSYILKTPTTETTDDDRSGVWFLDPSGADGPVGSLSLPTLTPGWEYEGWVVVDGIPVSTGRFIDPTGPDGSSAFSGPLAGPPFPGEDLIVNAPAGLSFPTDLTGATIAISVEPNPDDSPAPFAIKPLIGEVPAGLEVGTPLALGAGPADITGVATLNNVPGGVELAFTGVESWYLAIGASVLIAIGAAFVLSSRKFGISAS